jgi:hypothetical protein
MYGVIRENPLQTLLQTKNLVGERKSRTMVNRDRAATPCRSFRECQFRIVDLGTNAGDGIARELRLWQGYINRQHSQHAKMPPP